MSDQILKMCSRAGSDQNLRMGEDGGASSLEESKCLAGIFQQIVNDCKVSFFLPVLLFQQTVVSYKVVLFHFLLDSTKMLEQKIFYTRLR